MSADNYYVIRRAGDRYAVSMEFASGDEESDRPLGEACRQVWTPTPIDDPRIIWFDSLDEAHAYADAEYSEYGVTTQVSGDSSGDTFAARLTRAAGVFCDDDVDDEAYGWSSTTNNQDGSLEIQIGPVTCTLRAESTDAVWDLADWLMLTTPAAIHHGLGKARRV